MTRRFLKVEREIFEIISSYLLTHFQGEFSAMIAVSKIMLSKDFKKARVFIGSYGNQSSSKEDLEFLNLKAHQIEKHIQKKIRLKFYPKLVFLKDSSTDQILRVHKLFEQIKET